MKKKKLKAPRERKTEQKTRVEAKAKKTSSAKRASTSLVKEKPAKAIKSQKKKVSTKEGAADLLLSEKTKPESLPVKKASVEAWLGIVRDHIARTAEDGAPTGACSVPDPNGGPNLCVEMTEEACGSPTVKGTWIGGNC